MADRQVFLRFSTNVGSLNAEMMSAALSIQRVEDAYTKQAVSAQRGAISLEQANQKVIAAEKGKEAASVSSTGNMAAAESRLTQAKLQAADTQLRVNSQLKAAEQDVANAEAARVAAQEAAATRLNKEMLIGGTAVIAGFGLMAKAAADFQQQMTNAAAVSDYTRTHFEQMSQAVLDLSKNVPVSAKDLAQALITVEQAGLNGNQAIAALTISSKTAVANFTDVGTTTKVMSVLIHDYGMTLGEATNAMNVLTIAHQRGLGSFADIAAGVNSSAAVAKTLGVSYQEVAAGIASMTRAGVPASTAGMTLNRTLLQLEKQGSSTGKALQVALESMGFETGKAAVSALGLQGTLQGLFDSWRKGNTDLIAIFPQIRSFRGIAAEAADGGKLYADILNEMKDKTAAAAAAQKAYQTEQGSFQNQLKLTKNDVQALAISFGQAVLPAFRSALEAIRPLVNAIDSIPAPMKSVLALGTLLTAGFVAMMGGVRLLQTTWGTFTSTLKTAGDFWQRHTGQVEEDNVAIAQSKAQIAAATAQINAQTGAIEKNTVARRTNDETPLTQPMTGGAISTGPVIKEGGALAGGLGNVGSEINTVDQEVATSTSLFSRMGTSVASAASSVGSFVVSMGPTAAIIGAAALVMGQWNDRAQAAKRYADDAKGAVDALTQAFQAEAAGQANAVQQAVAQQIVQSGQIDLFKKYKVSIDDIVSAVNGNKSAQQSLVDTFTKGKNSSDAQAIGIDTITKALHGNKGAIKELADEAASPSNIQKVQGFLAPLKQFSTSGADLPTPKNTQLDSSQRSLAHLIETIAQLPPGAKEAAEAAGLLGNGLQQSGDDAQKAADQLNQYGQSAALAIAGLKTPQEGQTLMSDIITGNLAPSKILADAQKNLTDSTNSTTEATKAQNTALYDQAHALLQNEQNARGVINAQKSLADAKKALSDLDTFGLENQIEKQELETSRAVTEHQKAVDSLAKAQRALNDILAHPSQETDDAAENLEKAQLALTKANLDLADSKRTLDWSKGGIPEQVQKATIDYQEKLLGVKDAQTALTKAQKDNDDAQSGVTRAQKLADAEDAIAQAQMQEKSSVFALTDAQRTLNDLRGAGGQRQIADAEDKVAAAVLGVKSAYQQLQDAQIQQHNQQQQILDEQQKAQKSATKTTQVSLQQWADEEKKKVGDTTTFFDNIAKLAKDGHKGLAMQLSGLAKTNFDEANSLATQALSTNSTTLAEMDTTFDTASKEASASVQSNIEQLIQILPFLSTQMSDATLTNYVNGLLTGQATVGQLLQGFSQQTVDSVNSVLKAFGLPTVSLPDQNTGAPSPTGADTYGGGNRPGPQLPNPASAVNHLHFAEGGMEDHVAQIAPGGAWRLWAEPETGGEAYIPLAPSKRGRSEEIFGQVADRFGYKLQKYADGAFNLPPAPSVSQGSLGIPEAMGLDETVQKYADGGFNLPSVPAINQGSLGTPEVTGLDKTIHDAAVNFLNSAIASTQTGAGLEGSGYKALIDYLQRMHVPFNYPTTAQTTGGQHAAGSLHYLGRAADFTSPNGPAGMMLIFNTFLRVAQELSELFFTPAGFSIKNHNRVPPIAAAEHYNHVHAGIDAGTFTLAPGPGGADGKGRPGTPAQVDAWIKEAMKETGVPGYWLPGLEIIVMGESGGDPRSINTTDSNARAGNPSEGIAQTTLSTFRENMLPGHGDILNPVDNLDAAIRYILGRYGDIENVPGVKSIQAGGHYKPYSEGGFYMDSDGNGANSTGPQLSNPASVVTHLDALAEGGMEDHQAQIAPGGSWRLWAEPETGGEAYIPLAPSKRGRSEEIFGQVADKFGYQVHKQTDGAFDLPSVSSVSQVSPGTPGAMGRDQPVQKYADGAFNPFAANDHDNHVHTLGPGSGKGGTGPVPGYVTRWLTTALNVSGMGMNWLRGLEKLVMAKSGGDPHRHNPMLVRGEHAEGLFQLLPSMFRAHNHPGHDDAWNPVDNALSAIRYIDARYGTVYNIPLFKGGASKEFGAGGINFASFDNGGYLAPGLTMAYNGTGRSEVVSTTNATNPNEIARLVADAVRNALENQTKVNVNVHPAANASSRAIADDVVWAMKTEGRS